jgi:hypothetical protein
MGQPVKLSDALILDARITGEAQERSIARQIEFWAKLGRSVDSLLEGRQVLAIRRSGAAQPLSQALADVDTPAGRERVAAVLASQPYPHFEQYSGKPGLLVRIDEDGTETLGHFENRKFVPTRGIEAGGTVTAGSGVKIIAKGKFTKVVGAHPAKSTSANVNSKRTPPLRERRREREA